MKRERVAEEIYKLTPQSMNEFATQLLVECTDARLTVMTDYDGPLDDTFNWVTPEQLMPQLPALNAV